MHNLKYIEISSEDLKNVMLNVGQKMRDGKKNKNRTNFLRLQNDVKTQFDDYSNHFSGNDLSHIGSCLQTTSKEKQTLRSLYESGSEETSKLWKDLKRRNGDKIIICPICGHDFATELDHYVPREKYAEYSLHLWNLIPLCHYCNYNKGTLWLDANGNRIIFNAYLDTPAGSDYWVVNVTVQNNSPYVTIGIDNQKFNANNHIVEWSTVNELHLCSYYEEIVNSNLENTIYKIMQDRETYQNFSPKDLWDERCKRMRGYLRSPDKLKTEDMLEYKALLTQEFENWILHN